ncbi:NAD dependent epimerase/dehydratase [Histoplasma capsulatum G186AR]|uniref:NAD dependent epimerase/dehydratase n=1 Tax=Ajellomyces capsulatus TaxID=5037 RepID=A0A8H8D334_AJECA|nr:NAD dependent epimerase/dehydratase [Histoplasma capsulatum]QSS68278.1 NAD dependent epimerase/dehydratase [Histoplasma capsulatum G186AR]
MAYLRHEKYLVACHRSGTSAHFQLQLGSRHVLPHASEILRHMLHRRFSQQGETGLPEPCWRGTQPCPEGTITRARSRRKLGLICQLLGVISRPLGFFSSFISRFRACFPRFRMFCGFA